MTDENLLKAAKLVLALNRMPIDRCPRKIGTEHYVSGYPNDYYLVDLDPKALEQLQRAVDLAIIDRIPLDQPMNDEETAALDREAARSGDKLWRRNWK